MTKKKLSPNQFLAKELEVGISPFNPKFVASTKRTLEKFKEACAANHIPLTKATILDYGAGTGVYSETFRQAGYNVAAFDIWKSHRDFMTKTYPKLRVLSNPQPADIMLFIEVAEHMTDEEIIAAISEIKPAHILFSSTSSRNDYDETWGHINIKEQEAWVDFWDMLGYEKVTDVVKPTKWSFILKRI